MSVKGFKNYDEEGNFLGVEKYDYNSLEGIPKNFKNDTYEQDIQKLKTDVEKNVTDHNVSKDAHNDIRLLITDIINRINVIADSDDETLDQMSELVAYIKNNKTLIDSITTSKVNVSDIVNDLTTNVSNKPLSAEQGVVLKTLIDNLTRDLDTHGLSGNHIPTGGASGQILKWLSSGKEQWAKETVYASPTHKHSASDVTSGTLPVNRGGTGGTTAKDSAKSLGVPSLEGAIILGGDNGIKDLDTIKESGTYSCYTSSDISKISNCPTNGVAFVMYVISNKIYGSSTSHTTQIIIDANGVVYFRRLRVGTDKGVSWRIIGGAYTKLTGKVFVDKKYDGLDIFVVLYESFNIGFINVTGTLSTTRSKGQITYSYTKDYESNISSNNKQYVSTMVKLPDGTVRPDLLEVYAYNDHQSTSDTEDYLYVKLMATGEIPEGSNVSANGIFFILKK